MGRESDYKITTYFSRLAPDVEKFQIISAGMQYGVYKTRQEAVDIVKKLAKDPWLFDRGYTREDRCNSY